MQHSRDVRQFRDRMHGTFSLPLYQRLASYNGSIVDDSNDYHPETVNGISLVSTPTIR
eukprot:m.367032 g.367032  ORF g.367032 m.367032 type:complete len:58 (+) comp28097_c0_seq15:540-713(+)